VVWVREVHLLVLAVAIGVPRRKALVACCVASFKIEEKIWALLWIVCDFTSVHPKPTKMYHLELTRFTRIFLPAATDFDIYVRKTPAK